MNRIRKYLERMSDGRELRIAYAITVTALPDPRPRWQEVALFSAADELLAEPGLKSVFKTPLIEVSQSCRDRMFDLSPELPDDTLYEMVRLPTRI